MKTITEKQANQTAEVWSPLEIDTSLKSFHTQGLGNRAGEGLKDFKRQRIREFAVSLSPINSIFSF